MPKMNGSKKLLLVKDKENRSVYRIKKKKMIFDLDGNKLAEFSMVSKQTIDDKKVKVFEYTSENGKFETVGNKVYLNRDLVGNIVENKRGMSNLSLVFLTVFSVIAAIAFVSLIRPPYTGDVIPDFLILDSNGQWEEQGTVAVFDDKIYPGAEGKYDFIMTNEATGILVYSFSLEERYEGKLNIASFMEYRLKMNNVYLDKDSDGEGTWLKADKLFYEGFEFLPYSQQLMTLEWRWPYDSENDEQDTALGMENGKYYIVLNAKAEAKVEADVK